MVRTLISKTSFFALILISLLGCSKSVSPDGIIFKNGFAYNKLNHQLFSGYVRAYYADGGLMSVREYKNGLQDGYFIRFYKNRQISLKVVYKNGEPVNGYNLFYDNGAIKATRCDSSGYELIHRYYNDGKLYMLQHLKNGMLDGTSIQYYHDGSIFIYSNYIQDKKDGKFNTYHSNHKISAECKFINDTLDGNLKEWNDKGTLLCEEYYNHGKYTGVWKYYYQSGKINVVISFKPDGTVKDKIEYAENGTIVDKFSSE